MACGRASAEAPRSNAVENARVAFEVGDDGRPVRLGNSAGVSHRSVNARGRHPSQNVLPRAVAVAVEVGVKVWMGLGRLVGVRVTVALAGGDVASFRAWAAIGLGVAVLVGDVVWPGEADRTKHTSTETLVVRTSSPPVT